MKARVKHNNEIIDVIQVGTKSHLYDLNNVEFIDAPEDYWTRLKHQYAGMAMQGMLSNHLFFKDVDHVTNGKPEDMVTTIASSLATALVEKLKEGE